MSYYVYILASRKDGATYVGITNDIIRPVYEHRTKQSQASLPDTISHGWFGSKSMMIQFQRSLVKKAQEVETKLEGSIDRSPKSEVGRFVRFDLQLSSSFREGPKDQTSDAQLRIGESRDSIVLTAK
jgi:predicted GIY-YIG superfamily endonuclease